MLKKNFKKENGYTVIETMIAVSLFIIIIMAGMGALLNANLLHQKSRDMRSIIDNLSFAMEDMSRNLRTGYSYYCITGADNLSNVNGPKSGPNCRGIAFEHQNGDPANANDQWVYYIDNTKKLFKATAGPYISSNFIQLTPDEVKIETASVISVVGAGPPPGDLRQPFVTIKLVGTITITSQNVVTPFTLQTSISQRLLDTGN